MRTLRFNPTMVRLLRKLMPLKHKLLECFNPTMVRLLLSQLRACYLHRKKFQSHNGAIAAIYDCWNAVTTGGFNPTMVRLLREVIEMRNKRYVSFNPTMVRLLRLSGMSKRLIAEKFQSHNGAIAAKHCLSN